MLDCFPWVGPNEPRAIWKPDLSGARAEDQTENNCSILWRMLTVAHSLSAKKRIRQNETRRTINKIRSGFLKSQTRLFTDAVVAKDTAAAEAEFKKLTKRIDQTCAKGVMHKNQGARRKSRMQRQLNAIKSAG